MFGILGLAKYFGCRDENGNFNMAKFSENASKPSVKMIEIKLSQGAKPGWEKKKEKKKKKEKIQQNRRQGRHSSRKEGYARNCECQRTQSWRSQLFPFSSHCIFGRGRSCSILRQASSRLWKTCGNQALCRRPSGVCCHCPGLHQNRTVFGLYRKGAEISVKDVNSNLQFKDC